MKLNRTVTGTFNNDSLDNVLTGLGFTLNFEHSIENKNCQFEIIIAYEEKNAGQTLHRLKVRVYSNRLHKPFNL